MARNLLDYDVGDPWDWHPIKRLADAVIERHIVDLSIDLDWLWNWEHSPKSYKNKKSTKAKYHPTIKDLNHAYFFLTSDNLTVLSNHEANAAAMCEKINKYIIKKYGRDFCLKYIELIEYK